MLDVGLGYLTLNRVASSLSGGESQRINLTKTLGSNLSDSLYILDEPSIGLHPKDTTRLINVLKQLRDLGNTVVVVEHEEEIIKSSDYIVDIGPKAGVHGGEVVFQGNFKDIKNAKNSLTTKYLIGEEKITRSKTNDVYRKYIEIKGAMHHNLKNIDVKFPLHAITVVSGVSGSGKTTLVKKILYPSLMFQLGQFVEKPGAHRALEGDFRSLQFVEMIDQNPLGRSTRSNPVTYVKAFDFVRDLYASQPLSKQRKFQSKEFSFNVPGGRCESCKGDGVQLVSMQFLADIELECEDCKGKRYKDEVLEVRYKDKNIYEVLEMTIDDAIEFFEDKKSIYDRIKPFADIGLGYLKLGQSSSTLSGGEAQRVKLASYLNKSNATNQGLFIFDEPTTGLHFYDVQKLLYAMERLIDMGHSVMIIEHNMDMIRNADWVIDLGPEGGDLGGQLLYQGPIKDFDRAKESYTAKFL
jgi:excinuclease ABC subunit A